MIQSRQAHAWGRFNDGETLCSMSILYICATKLITLNIRILTCAWVLLLHLNLQCNTHDNGSDLKIKNKVASLLSALVAEKFLIRRMKLENFLQNPPLFFQKRIFAPLYGNGAVVLRILRCNCYVLTLFICQF